MIKLSEKLIQRYSAALQHVGDDFGISVIPDDAKFFLCDLAGIYPPFTDCEFCDDFAFAVFIDNSNYYFSIHGLVYSCKRYFRYGFSFEEIAVLFYLIFEKHKTFNL